MNEVRFYKPRKTMDGAASKFEARLKSKEYEKDGEKRKYDEWMAFLVISQQKPELVNDEAAFFWDRADNKQITMKLSDTDIADILLVLSGRKPNIGGERGLYHQNDNGNSALQFKTYNDGYAMCVSAQDKAKNLTKIQHTFTAAEGELLRIFLDGFLRRKYL